MNRELKNISNELDSFYLDIFTKVDNAAASHRIQFCIVGASAMYILIKYYYNNELRLRTTADIDLSIMINDWQKFNEFSQTLINNFGFIKTDIEHRLMYNGIPIDIIPFGPIANPDKTINWLSTGRQFNVMGFEETLNFSVPLQICNEPLLIINFASIAGITVLKLLAWSDAFPKRKKDAEDFFLLLNNYGDFGNLERMFEEKTILNSYNADFDSYQASAMLLAYDIQNMADPDTIAEILFILDPSGDKFEKLIIDIIGNKEYETNFEKTSRLITIFYDSFSK